MDVCSRPISGIQGLRGDSAFSDRDKIDRLVRLSLYASTALKQKQSSKYLHVCDILLLNLDLKGLVETMSASMLGLSLHSE